jgi:carboxyl-terminal processing protease
MNIIRAITIAVVMFTAGIIVTVSAPLPIDQLREFSEVFGQIKTNYVEEVDDKKLLENAIRGMVSGLDPHSDYLNTSELKELNEGVQGEFGGLGIEVGMEDGWVKVISPIDDTPAAKGDIRTGDLIIKINDTNVKGLTLADSVKLMRGKPNTDIVLTIVRKGEEKPLVKKLTRMVIVVQSVKSKLIEPGYAYIKLTQFQEHSTEKMADSIRTMWKANKDPMKGIVLDLRNDPGGLLNAAIGVSTIFLQKNALVVYTEGRGEGTKARLYASPQFYLHMGEPDYLADLPADVKTLPMVVLVNGGSASASEIVAGALKDNKRAVIMGETTFGKASVQAILPVGNGSTAVKLTIARYFTPSGYLMQNKGIVPDVVVEQATIVPVDKGLTTREADLGKHLTNPNGDQPAQEVIKPADAKSDYQLNQALALLKGLNILKK